MPRLLTPAAQVPLRLAGPTGPTGPGSGLPRVWRPSLTPGPSSSTRPSHSRTAPCPDLTHAHTRPPSRHAALLPTCVQTSYTQARRRGRACVAHCVHTHLTHTRAFAHMEKELPGYARPQGHDLFVGSETRHVACAWPGPGKPSEVKNAFPGGRCEDLVDTHTCTHTTRTHMCTHAHADVCAHAAAGSSGGGAAAECGRCAPPPRASPTATAFIFESRFNRNNCL